MGTCVTVIKLVGFSSLGLLTSSLTYQSFQTIPELIRRLNNQVSIGAASASVVLSAAATNVLVSRAANVLLASLLSALFATAYRYSPPSAKHPYLLYSAFGAPVALLSLYSSAASAETRIVKRSRARSARLAEKKKKTPVVAPAVADDDESQLGKSYIHVSDDSLSNTSTPGSSTPGSPAQTATETVEPTTSAIEQEVEDALSKKEYVHDLERLQSAYTVASSVAGVGFAVCTIGMVGDYYFL